MLLPFGRDEPPELFQRRICDLVVPCVKHILEWAFATRESRIGRMVPHLNIRQRGLFICSARSPHMDGQGQRVIDDDDARATPEKIRSRRPAVVVQHHSIEQEDLLEKPTVFVGGELVAGIPLLKSFD